MSKQPDRERCLVDRWVVAPAAGHVFRCRPECLADRVAQILQLLQMVEAEEAEEAEPLAGRARASSPESTQRTSTCLYMHKTKGGQIGFWNGVYVLKS